MLQKLNLMGKTNHTDRRLTFLTNVYSDTFELKECVIKEWLKHFKNAITNSH